ncbi:substrate-binding periplasmic protein [Pseudomonas sp. DC3200b2]|uniref:substrate-binding periplasmic protein n=1 Tax=Pseudomonas sp. DC3200b2 TaxID=2804669 RepID=UPI003CF0AC15
MASRALAQPIEAVTEESSYSYMEDGKVAGPATSVVTTVLERAGLSEYHLAMYPWARAYDIALGEPNVLIFPIIRTPEREAHFKWVGEFEEIQTVLYKLRERSDLVIAQLADAQEHNLGVVRDDVRHQYLRGNGFTRLVISATPMDNLRKLLAGQVDMVPLSPRDARRFCEELGMPFENLEAVMPLSQITVHAYLAFSLGTSDELVRRAVEAFRQLQRDGELKRLMVPR